MTSLPSSSGHSEGITPILELVVAMASNPSPADHVFRGQFIELAPQILVLYGLSI
jgi:hypothetical protein